MKLAISIPSPANSTIARRVCLLFPGSLEGSSLNNLTSPSGCQPLNPAASFLMEANKEATCPTRING